MKQNKHQLEHLPTLLVQQIRLQWYKDCRGGKAAAQRNQYPRVMRLPKDFFSYWNRYQALRREGVGEDDPKTPFRLAHEGTLNDGCFDNGFFYEAFHKFDNQSIEQSLVSENPLVRIFSLLDRRLGKRRLLALEESMEQELEWVRAFYVIRMQAEGLMEKE